jgi:N-acetylglutamate synthase-like GNAT family acetyltransferase
MKTLPLGGSLRRVFGAHLEAEIRIRTATRADLPRVNDLITRAIDTWRVSDRVKRISLPLYRIQADELAYFQVIVAEDERGEIVGVAAIEPPGAVTGSKQEGFNMLLHGIYVDPAQHRNGVGSRLLSRVEAMVAEQGCHGLLVKARADAAGFFEARGFERLPVSDAARDYPHRYWKRI